MLKQYSMKMHGEMDVRIHAFWTSAGGGNEWLASSFGLITTEEEPPVPSG
jgi:hypothetical protein